VNLKQEISKILLPNNKLIVLNYHQVSEYFDPQIHFRFTWTPLAVFEKHLSFLTNNYQILPLQEAIEKLKNQEIKNTVFSITFDDGDQSLEQYVYPALVKRQIPATFFINTAYLEELKGNWFNIFRYLENSPLAEIYLTEELWQKFITARKTMNSNEYDSICSELEAFASKLPDDVHFYVNKEFLKNIDSTLIHLGLHGHEHQRFSMKTIDWQRQDIQKNIDELKQYPSYVPIFSIPFGKPHDWTQETLKLAYSFGLTPVLSNSGYNVKYDQAIMQITCDDRSIEEMLENLSPFPKTYYEMNGLKWNNKQ